MSKLFDPPETLDKIHETVIPTMLSLTRKTDYALVALASLGRRRRAGDGPISARAIAEQFGLPQPLLMNVLKELAQAKIVVSTRGAAGGYEMARDPAHVSVLDVVTAIDGPVRLAQCCDGLPVIGQGCVIEGASCPARSAVRMLHQRVIGLFEQMTLQDLLAVADDPGPTETCQCQMAAAAAIETRK